MAKLYADIGRYETKYNGLCVQDCRWFSIMAKSYPDIGGTVKYEI
jgi:hypothetical protein